jgi:hypothetical protein
MALNLCNMLIYGGGTGSPLARLKSTNPAPLAGRMEHAGTPTLPRRNALPSQRVPRMPSIALSVL